MFTANRRVRSLPDKAVLGALVLMPSAVRNRGDNNKAL